MSQVSKEYLVLFNGISTCIEEMEAMVFRLKNLQTQAEELFISNDEDQTPSQ